VGDGRAAARLQVLEGLRPLLDQALLEALGLGAPVHVRIHLVS
jgi:hypothetical protein